MITLQEARGQLQSTHSADDEDLQIKINAAVSAVVKYLGVADSASIPPEALPQAKLAALVIVSRYYADREGLEDAGAVDSQFGYGYLPVAAIRLLYPFRKPVIA